MAIFNGFPATYQPMYYQQQYQPSQTTQPQMTQQNNGIIWVQGEAGAKSYLVAPNTTVQLWDSESQVIYLKSADASGMPSMKVLDYTIRNMPSTNVPTSQSINETNYATKSDLKSLYARLEALEMAISNEHKTEVVSND